MRWRVATYNLENFGAPGHHGDLQARRIATLRATLGKLDADILCLQEIGSSRPPAGGPRDLDQLDALVRDTPCEGFHRAASTRPRSAELADIHNLVILSRWPIRASSQVFHDLVPPMTWTPPRLDGEAPNSVDVQWERPILQAEIALPCGEAVHIVNVHLRAPRAAFIPGVKHGHAWASSAAWAEGLYLAALKRDGQALELRLLIDRLFDRAPDARILVCGDFNAEPRDMALRIIRAARDEHEQGWPEARELVAIEERITPERRYSVLHADRRLLPDHILASRSLARYCVAARIFNDDLDDESSDAPPVGSFHAPVVADFEAPG